MVALHLLAAEATGVNTTVLNGALLLALPLSLLAGLVSFFSPASCRWSPATCPT